MAANSYSKPGLQTLLLHHSGVHLWETGCQPVLKSRPDYKLSFFFGELESLFLSASSKSQPGLQTEMLDLSASANSQARL